MEQAEKNNNSIKEKLEKAIEQGKVKMIPKAYFTLKTTFLAVSFFTLFFIILFLTSFIAFAVRVRGIFLLPQFGFKGVIMFFISLPWLLILLAILLFFVLELLAKKFALVYRRLIIYSVLFFVLVAFVGALLIDRSNIHDRFFERARMGSLPLAGPVYRNFALCDDCSFHRGFIVEILEDGFMFEDIGRKVFEVTIGPQTKLKGNYQIILNDEVIVIGEIDDGIIEAIEISKCGQGPRRIFFAPPLPIKFRAKVNL